MTSDFVNVSADCFIRSDGVFTLASGPQISAYNGNINGFCFSPDFKWFAAALSVSPYVAIFQMSGQAFGSQIPNPSTLPPGAAQSVSFSPNSEYLFVGDQSGTSPYMTIYQMNVTSGTATAIANPSVLPAGAAYYGDWSRSKKYLAIAGPVSPYLQVYQTASTLNTSALLWARVNPYVI
jgi:WD40 repeat protein